LTPLALDSFFRDFKAFGGVAIETVTGSHTVDQYDEYTKIANKYDFLVSRGSDFHSPEDAEIDIGKLPPMPKASKPVWEAWFSA